MATTDTQVQQLVINVGTKAQIEAAIAGGTITQDMLSVATDGDDYIQGVKVNGTELTPDSNNKVDVTVPTDTGDLTNNAGYITSSALTGYATETWVGQQGFLTSTSLSGYATETWVQNQGYITNSALSNYVTLNTLQTLTSGKKIFANDVNMAGNQTAVLATISNSTTKTSDNAWVGRYICGAKNLTFLMGTYRTMAGIGVHTWTNAQTGAGAGWGDFYLNPDGQTTVYIGGNWWTKDSGWLKVKNTGNTGGLIQVNKGSISSASWKDVAYKGENVKDFSFTSISGYDSTKTQTLKHINGTLTWVDD